MKYEILKKTLLYRVLAFGLGTFITTLFLFHDPILSFNITLVSEGASVGLYYIYEYFWRRRMNSKKLKEGMKMYSANDKHGWYNVIKVLEDNKFIIEVV